MVFTPVALAGTWRWTNEAAPMLAAAKIVTSCVRRVMLAREEVNRICRILTGIEGLPGFISIEVYLLAASSRVLDPCRASN